MTYRKCTLSNRNTHKDCSFQMRSFCYSAQEKLSYTVHMRKVSCRESSCAHCAGWGSGFGFLSQGKDDIRENSTTASVWRKEKFLLFYFIVTLTSGGEENQRGVKNILFRAQFEW